VIVDAPPNPVLLQINDSAQLSCEAAGGPQLVITWMKGDLVISTGSIGDTVVQFLILSATYDDENNYTCVASIDGEQVSISTSVMGKMMQANMCMHLSSHKNLIAVV